MTKAEFAEVMKVLSCAYRGKFAVKPDDTKEVKDEILQTWYHFFKNYRVDSLREITEEWIVKEGKAPQINDIRTKVRLLDERMDKKESEEREHEEFIKTHDLALGIEEEGFDEDRAKHPFEDGWRITDEGYWINRQHELRKV